MGKVNMRSIRRIYIHHTGHQATIPNEAIGRADVERWHLAAGYEEIGYHRLILFDGQVLQGREDWKIGAHCRGSNSDSLGICIVGNFEREPASLEDPRIQALIQTLAVLCKRYSIPVEKILGHRDSYNTACPGRNLYRLLPQIREEVRKYL